MCLRELKPGNFTSTFAGDEKLLTTWLEPEVPRVFWFGGGDHRFERRWTRYRVDTMIDRYIFKIDRIRLVRLHYRLD